MRQPPWMAEAWAEYGQRERAGDADNPRIVRMLAELGHSGLGDGTPWCAAFVGACLERAGVTSTRSLLARSYCNWGRPAQEMDLGTVVVLSRGADPALGHVGFLVGESGGNLLVLGGNQSDAVGVAAFPRDRLVAFRQPPGEVVTTRPGAAFETALLHVLEMEGGFTDDPHDPGGPTNKGITLAVFAAYRGVAIDAANRSALVAALRAIPDTTVREIYLRRYWLPARCADLPPPLALMHFDAAVNHGVGAAARMLQEALAVEIDGEIGPLTRAAAAATPSTRALSAYAEIRRRRYRALVHFWRFGRGWLRRVDETLALASGMAAGQRTPPTPTQQKDAPIMSDTTPFPQTPTPAPTADLDGKWWGHSMTVWGALITAATTVLPLLGSAFGFNLTPDLIERLGQDLVVLAQAIGGVVGTVITIIGRARASTTLSRRPVRLQL